jgi:hypothetical protein
VDIDTELQRFINDIPSFFSMTTTELETNYQLSPLRARSIVQQGSCLHSFTWSLRCRLHIPYLSRRVVEAEYAASQDICLHSAQQIIKTETLLSNSGLFATRYKLLTNLKSVFMASVVILLVDISHKKSSTQRNLSSGEIWHAIRILEHARQKSETAAKFLESLMCVVNRYKVYKPAAQVELGEMSYDGARMYNTATDAQAVGSLPPITPTSLLGSNDLGYMDIVHDSPEKGAGISEYFNGLAQSFEQGVDFGSVDWDGILSELEPSIV